jgi:hypothetical protein
METPQLSDELQYQGTRIANAPFPSRKPAPATQPAGGGSDLCHIVAGIPLKRKAFTGKKKPAVKKSRLARHKAMFDYFSLSPLTARFLGRWPLPDNLT